MINSKLKGTCVSLEAVQHQVNNSYTADVVSEIQRILGPSFIYETAEEVVDNIAVILSKRFNTIIQIHLENEPTIDVAAGLPNLDRNHVFARLYYDDLGNREYKEFLSHYKQTKMAGGVDLKSAKLTGDFSKMTGRVYLTSGVFSGKLTAEEITAMILHEVGHIFNYYVLLGNNSAMNVIMSAAVSELGDSKSPEYAVELLSKIEKDFDLKISDKDLVRSAPNQDTVRSLVLKASMDKMSHEHGCDIYSIRGSEMMADQFAIRVGGGAHLATAFDKFKSDNESTSIFMHLMYQSGYVLLASSLGVMTGGITIFFMCLFALVYDPSGGNYDPPKERLLAIKRELISKLKNKKYDQKRAAELLREIETVEQIANKYHNWLGFYDKLITWIKPSANRNAKKIAEQKALEMLANSDLYYYSEKLKHI